MRAVAGAVPALSLGMKEDEDDEDDDDDDEDDY